MILIKLNKCHRIIPCKNGIVLLYKENKHQINEKGIYINNDNCNKLHKLLELKDYDKQDNHI